MERSQILATMGELKLYGMKTAFDQIITAAVKRQHEPQRVIGDFLAAEVAEKQARSIKYQIAIAKLPLAKDIDDFHFDNTPVNETLERFQPDWKHSSSNFASNFIGLTSLRDFQSA